MPSIVDISNRSTWQQLRPWVQGGPVGIVFHDTGGPSLGSALNSFHDSNASYNYLIDTDGTVYQYTPDGMAAGHAGVAVSKAFVQQGLGNRNMIGVAYVGNDSEHLTEAQQNAGLDLANYLQSVYPNLDPKNVFGHGEFAAGHRDITEGQATAQWIRDHGFGIPGNPVEPNVGGDQPPDPAASSLDSIFGGHPPVMENIPPFGFGGQIGSAGFADFGLPNEVLPHLNDSIWAANAQNWWQPSTFQVAPPLPAGNNTPPGFGATAPAAADQYRTGPLNVPPDFGAAAPSWPDQYRSNPINPAPNFGVPAPTWQDQYRSDPVDFGYENPAPNFGDMAPSWPDQYDPGDISNFDSNPAPDFGANYPAAADQYRSDVPQWQQEWNDAVANYGFGNFGYDDQGNITAWGQLPPGPGSLGELQVPDFYRTGDINAAGDDQGDEAAGQPPLPILDLSRLPVSNLSARPWPAQMPGGAGTMQDPAFYYTNVPGYFSTPQTQGDIQQYLGNPSATANAFGGIAGTLAGNNSWNSPILTGTPVSHSYTGEGITTQGNAGFGMGNRVVAGLSGEDMGLPRAGFYDDSPGWYYDASGRMIMQNWKNPYEPWSGGRDPGQGLGGAAAIVGGGSVSLLKKTT